MNCFTIPQSTNSVVLWLLMNKKLENDRNSVVAVDRQILIKFLSISSTQSSTLSMSVSKRVFSTGACLLNYHCYCFSGRHAFHWPIFVAEVGVESNRALRKLSFSSSNIFVFLNSITIL